MQTEHAARYAQGLLVDLGMPDSDFPLADHPALAWRRSGLFQITGHVLPLALASHADGVLMALKTLSPEAQNLPENGSMLLGERGRLRDLKRQGRLTAGGYGRLLVARDGTIALNLVRQEDWDLIPAWLEVDANSWDDIKAIVKGMAVRTLVERASDLGLAAAESYVPQRPKSWFSQQGFTPAKCELPLVVDLSSLWAGPLASSLLAMCGAKVVKVESPQRPDGMRLGHSGFYALINGGKDCAAFDFQNPSGIQDLKALLERADIVIEASRPRALRQLGISAEAFVARKPGKIWARLTAYGRQSARIGFGDDIGVAAGLSAVVEAAYGQACFAADAIADPISGLHLALAIQASLCRGGGAVIDISMADCVRFAMGSLPGELKDTAAHWKELTASDTEPLYKLRTPLGPAKALGTDTAKYV